jgi:hypothetical protein
VVLLAAACGVLCLVLSVAERRQKIRNIAAKNARRMASCRIRYQRQKLSMEKERRSPLKATSGAMDMYFTPALGEVLAVWHY